MNGADRGFRRASGLTWKLKTGLGLGDERHAVAVAADAEAPAHRVRPQPPCGGYRPEPELDGGLPAALVAPPSDVRADALDVLLEPAHRGLVDEDRRRGCARG